jgi:deoxyribonuclease-1-like protein
MSIPLMRFFGPSSTLVALLIGGWYLLTHAPPAVDMGATVASSQTPGFPGTLGLPTKPGVPNNMPLPGTVAQTPNMGRMPTTAPQMGAAPLGPPPVARMKPNDRIVVGTFNIKDFGVKKTSDKMVMAVLADIIRRFDVLAIQEISSADQDVLLPLLSQVNLLGGRYTGVLSKRIGRTSQKEQYAFVWDTTRIQMIPQSSYEVYDPSDLMEREPFAASFQVNIPSRDGWQPFSFTLVNVHTDPDVAAKELDVLDDVFRSIRSYGFPEDDVMMLGDLNAGPNKLQQLGQLPGIFSAGGVEPTNTRGDKQYDYILFDRFATSEFIPGRGGVLSLQRDLGLDLPTALLVSDHCPVWAEFGLFERSPPSVANTAATGSR